MIRMMEPDELNTVSEYVYKLNNKKENQCRPFNNDYTLDVVIEKYSELHYQEGNSVLVAFDEDNALYGVLGIFRESNELYMQAFGGLYTHLDYDAVFSEFESYLKHNYKGYKMLFAFPLENEKAIDTMIKYNYKQIENAVIFENEVLDFYVEDCPYIFGYHDLDEIEIESFYNEYQGDVYWTLDKLKQNQSDWIIKNYVLDNEIKASLYLHVYDHYNAEVFGIVYKDELLVEVVTPLLRYAINDCLSLGIKNIIVFADHPVIIEACNDIKLMEIDTHLTFEKVYKL